MAGEEISKVTTKVTLESRGGDIVLAMPGHVTDEEWKEKQAITEARYQARTVKSDVRRLEGVWVTLE